MFVENFRCILIILIFFLQISSISPTTLYRHSLTKYPEAVCIDGSPAIYYDENGDGIESARAARNVVIFLEGGGYCHDPALCLWRCSIAPWLCTGKNRPRIKQGYGFLSNDPESNPGFYDYYKVDLPYCSGDFYRGRRNADRDTNGQHFNGLAIFDALIDDLKQRVLLTKTERVIFGGSSAGGAGVTFNCDYLQSKLPNTSVYCVIDAAFYYPVAGPLHNTSFCESLDKVLKLGGDLWNAPEVKHFDLNGPWWRAIHGKIFIGSARFDRFGLDSFCADIKNKSDLRDWESGVMEKTQWIQDEDPDISFFIPACMHHMMLADEMIYSQMKTGQHGMTYGQALKQWVYTEEPVHVWDKCLDKLFCNGHCLKDRWIG